MITKKEIKRRVKECLGVGRGYRGGYFIHCSDCNHEVNTKQEVIETIYNEIQEDSEQYITVGTYYKEYGEWYPSEGGITIYSKDEGGQ